MKMLKTIAAVLCCAFVSLACVSCDGNWDGLDLGLHAPDYSEDDGKDDSKEPAVTKDEFVILFTNDFHSQIEPLSQEETYNAGRGGIKRIKALVDSVRAAEPAVILADAGDLVQGTYYFSLLNGRSEEHTSELQSL